jgi:hypothetical protein
MIGRAWEVLLQPADQESLIACCGIVQRRKVARELGREANNPASNN